MERFTFSQKGAFDYKNVNRDDPVGEIFTLFLRDSSLVIRKDRKALGRNGGYYYKTLETMIYTAHENHHGEKYLKVYRKTNVGQIFRVDTPALKYDHFMYSSDSGGGFHCKEMTQTIENHMSKILGFTFTYKPCPNTSVEYWNTKNDEWNSTPDALCYPFLRNRKNRIFLQQLLLEDEKRSLISEIIENTNLNYVGVRGWANAARHSNSPEEFITNMVYKSSVRTAEDVQCLLNNPHLLRVFSFMDLRMGAKRALELGYAQTFHDFHEYMSIHELLCFKFLLQNLPISTTVAVLDLAVQLATYRAAKHHEDPLNPNADISLIRLVEDQSQYAYTSIQHGNAGYLASSLRNVPVSSRREFAVSFWEEFKAAYLLTERSWEERYSTFSSVRRWSDDRHKCFVPALHVFMKTYAQKYLVTIPDGSIERVKETALELFGVDLESYATVKTERATVSDLDVTVDYYNFQDHLGWKPNQPEEISIFTQFRKQRDLLWAHWDNATFTVPFTIFRDYLGLHGSGHMMLASKLEQVLRKFAEIIDAELTKLGQEVNVKNRNLFLAADISDRKYKYNWRYYHLGVSGDEVRLYKKAGIKNKKDVLFWLESKRSMPHELYKELLNDAAGVETPVS